MLDVPAALAAAKSFDAFKQAALAAGFDEALERSWAPGHETGTHTHPFDAAALVVAGDMWLQSETSGARHIAAGGTFALAAHTPHAERYGPAGASYWVARRSA